jgi:hypothetical protein
MIELAALYGVLRVVAMNKGIVSLEDLSRFYHEATGDWHEPQERTWHGPLAKLNGHTRAAGLSRLEEPRPEGLLGVTPGVVHEFPSGPRGPMVAH